METGRDPCCNVIAGACGYNCPSVSSVNYCSCTFIFILKISFTKRLTMITTLYTYRWWMHSYPKAIHCPILPIIRHCNYVSFTTSFASQLEYWLSSSISSMFLKTRYFQGNLVCRLVNYTCDYIPKAI